MSQEADVTELTAHDSFVIPSVPLEAASFERELDHHDERAGAPSDSVEEATAEQSNVPVGQEAAAPHLTSEGIAAAPEKAAQLEIELDDGVPDPVRDGRMALPEFPADMDMQHGTADEPPDLLPAFDTPDVMNPDGTPVTNNSFVDQMLEPEITTEARLVMGDNSADAERPPLNRIARASSSGTSRAPLPPFNAAAAAAAAVSAQAVSVDPIPVRPSKPGAASEAATMAVSTAAAAADQSDATKKKPKDEKADNLVFEYGPLDGFAHQIGNLIDQNAVSPSGAMKLRDTVNRLISVAVQENPTALFDERGKPFAAETENGIEGRLLVLQELQSGLRQMAPGAEGEWDVQSSSGNLVNLVDSAVGGEIARIEKSKELLQTPTLAQSVVGGITNMFKGLAHNGEKAADVREYRNNQLNESLASLERTAKDFKTNAGDAGWMAANGPAAMLSARDQRDRIGELASDLSGRLDQGLFSRRMKGISEAFGEAQDTATEEKSKKELAKMIESITEMVTKLAERVKNMFQQVRKPQP